MTNTSPVFYKLSLHTLSLKFTTVFQVFLNCSFKSFLWTSFRHTATHLRKLWLKWLDAHTHLVVMRLHTRLVVMRLHTCLVVDVLTYMPGGGRAYIHAWWWTCLHTCLVVNVLTYTPGGEHAHVVQSTTHNIEDELLCTSDEICSHNVQWALTLSCTDTTAKEKYLWPNYCTSCSLAV